MTKWLSQGRQKHAIDRIVARELGMSAVEVSTVTGAFMREIARTIASQGGVTIEGFGKFRLSRFKFKPGNIRLRKLIGDRKQSDVATHIDIDEFIRITFTKSQEFRNIIREAQMSLDKYAVDEGVNQEELEKKANAGCPECGKKLVQHGKVLLCPIHGSEPLEKTK